MHVPRRQHRTIGVLITLVVALGRMGLGENIRADALTDARTKGLVVLRATFPSRGEVWRVSLLSSEDGERFSQAGIGALGRKIVWSITDDGKVTTVFVPALGWYGKDASFFDGRGPHWLRWTITFRDQSKPRTAEDQRAKDIEPLEFDQRLDVLEPHRSDLAFISRLGEVERIETLLGREWLEQWRKEVQQEILARTSEAVDLPALAVIGQILEGTGHESPWYVMQDRKSAERCLAWANSLWEVARESADSSYAPYAAWYAGCCYAAAVIRSGNAQDGRLFSEALAREDDFKAADVAFVFAVERADTYLKPIVLLHRAYLAGFGGQWEKSEGLLTAALDAAPGNDKMRDRGIKFRNDLAKVRARHGVEPRDTSR